MSVVNILFLLIKNSLRAQARTAILTSKKAVDAQQRSNRDELFSNYNGSAQNGNSQSEKITYVNYYLSLVLSNH